ncbi:LacI family transcriptional regulator [Rhodococcus sp. 06-412-2C]|uniref:LacI family DNA-binding transcriptional regulator n=1 Tax=unclassified Rhodococcus (in: high G+C Gram-positive bacteria) TaxID=192944 RepID=UPI000B9AFA71|nr:MULTISPECIES: LacI family DNA-binding transcriptional regulator [unclassified Rhodococcus (in: high G+C Gram-positive bacteria)]OZC81749.1 LacI family transcriptional regulator [Rhodococcus sp. 06-412-2C]OZC96023.1 LacI family transcriptional regulator [Rhodococcus sp. 06-412-2B]
MVAKLKDVALEAGVSMATASRAFSSVDLLAPHTRQRVLEAARRIGYDAPAPTRSRTILVLVPDVSNAVYARMLRAIQEKLWPGRHRMILADTAEDPAREIELLDTVGREADAVILCSPRSNPVDVARAIGSTPLVVVNGESNGSPAILMDVEQGLRQAAEHLQSLGHRSFVYVPGPAASWANRTRAQILSDLSSERGFDLAVVGNQSADVHGGLAAAAAVVASGATAVVAYNDMVAMGVQAGIRSLGYRCPTDISIVGIDNVDIAAASDPGLTTVMVDIESSGSLSIGLIMDQLDGKPWREDSVRLRSQLIVRGSTARPPESAPGSARSARGTTRSASTAR